MYPAFTAQDLDPLGPLTYSDAAALLGSVARTNAGVVDRLLHARALLAVQSYDLASSELTDLERRLPPGPLKARAQVDLLLLAYYLGQRADVQKLSEGASTLVGPHPLLRAELYLAMSVCAIGDNDVRRAMDALRFAADALRPARPRRDRDIVEVRIERQAAHVLANAADYREAIAAADRAIDLAGRVCDAWELAWSTYAKGFAAWFQGGITVASSLFEEADRRLRPTRAPLWRWVLFCLAHTRAERGDHNVALMLAHEAAFDAPEEFAYLTLLGGNVQAARRILAVARSALPYEVPFRDAVNGLVLTREGSTRQAAQVLARAEAQFRAAGLQHYAIACALHGAFAREQALAGSGQARAREGLNELAQRGGSGFAWFHPEVARWLVRVAEGRKETAPTAYALRGRTTAVQPGPVGDWITRSRELGLTWREIDVLRALAASAEGGERLERGELAARLGISPNTLRVHLHRIRGKLGVTKRGDVALARAIEEQGSH